MRRLCACCGRSAALVVRRDARADGAGGRAARRAGVGALRHRPRAPVTATHGDAARSTSRSVLYLAIGARSGSCSAGSRSCWSRRIGERFLRDLRNRLFGHMMSLSLDYFETEKTGTHRRPHDLRHRRAAGARSRRASCCSCRTCSCSSARSSSSLVDVVAACARRARSSCRRCTSRAVGSGGCRTRRTSRCAIASRPTCRRCRRASKACGSCRHSAGRASFTRRFERTNEDQYAANMLHRADLGEVLPGHRVRRRRRHRRDHRLRRLAVDQGHRHGRHGRGVRALAEQPVRADQPAEPAVQHRAVGRRRARQDLRRARHAPDGRASARARSICPRRGRDRGRRT